MAKLKVWKFFSVWMVLVLVVGLGAALVPVGRAEAATATWYVDPAGTDNATQGTGPGAAAFKTIQYAITSSGSGDTINVAAGTYQGDLIISKSLTLQGAGRTTTTILRNIATSQVIRIGADDITITGFKIDGGPAHACENLVADPSSATPYNRTQITLCHLLNCSGSAIYWNYNGTWPPTARPTGTGSKVNDNIIEHFGSHSGTAGIEAAQQLNLEVKRNTIRDANPDSGNTYGATGVYFFDFTSGTIADNNFSRVVCAVVVNSNVGETYVTNNTASECIRGIFQAESFAKIHITGNTISTRPDPGNPTRAQFGIYLGGDGDYYDSCPPYPYQVDNLQHEVSGNIVTGSGTATSLGIKVQPGAFDDDYGASGTVNGNTISNYDIGLKVYGNGADPGTVDRTSHVHVSFANNVITGSATDASVSAWTGAAGSINAENNWWGSNTGPALASDRFDVDPWLVIGVSASPTSIVVGGGATSTIIADMTKNSAGNPSGGYVPNGTQITFTTNKGSIGSLTVNKTTTNGIATATLTSSSTVETATVTASAPPHTVAATVSTNVNFVAGSSQQVGTATGTGTATFTTSGGSVTGLTAVALGTLPTAGKPVGVIFPYGLFSFNITNIAPGSTVTVTITLPSNIPVGAQYWKCQNGIWVDCTSLLGDNDGDNVLTLTLTDGGLGDADGVANGTIVDPGGPAVPVVPAPAPAPRASPAPPTQLQPAQLSLQYLSVNPKQAAANQPVTITTNVVNTGDEAGNYNVALKINGQVEQTRMVSVGPQGTQPVKLTVTKAQPGTYTVDIGGQRGSFVVLGAGGTAGAPVNGGLIAILIMGVLILTTVVVLLATFRRRAC